MESLTLYARWQSNGGIEEPVETYTVTYYNGGMGSDTAPLTVAGGTILYESHLPELTFAGYVFQGWYYNDMKIIPGQFKVTSNITLTAKWIKEEPADTTSPGEVTNLEVKLENNYAVLTWINPSDNDFKTVEVSYKTSDESAAYGDHKSTGAGNADTYTLSKRIGNIQDFTFTVKTVDYNGNKSEGVSVAGSGEVVNPDPEPEPEPDPDFSKYKNKTVWLYSVNGPLPNDSIWKKPGNDSVWELDWKESYGWYDVNKTNLVDKENNNDVIAADSSLCWAATAANMLHWWFKLNDKYIKEYDKINSSKLAERPDAAYPKQNINEKITWASKYQESEIFQYFIDHFEDKGGWTDVGINWYVSGEKSSAAYNSGGFFADVFPKGKYVSTKYTGLSKERFNEVIINAIETNRAIGVVMSGSVISHMVTIWGAEFDADGYIKALYIADNNVNQTTAPYTKNLTRRLVRYGYYEGTTATFPEISNYIETSFAPATALVDLDLGIQYWEEYFKSKGITIK